MVMAQSLFKTLKTNHSECQIDVLAPQWTFSLLDRMPEVNNAVGMPFEHGHLGLIERLQLGMQLKSEHYDQAILLPNSWKSAITPFFANIPVRTGYIGECRWGLLNDARKLDKEILTMTVQRFVALGLATQPQEITAWPIPEFSIDNNNTRNVINKFDIDLSKKIIALCPGAEYGAAKRWPTDYFAEVATQSIANGWQIWLFGSNKELSITSEINQKTGNICKNLSGMTTLAEAVDLMSLTNVVVSNDSGLMHVAAALNKKIIVIYGSSDPTFTPPLNDNSTIMTLGLECSPCFKRECPFGHYHCLVNINPASVLAEINACV
jgi:heptosyltransferase-2